MNKLSSDGGDAGPSTALRFGRDDNSFSAAKESGIAIPHLCEMWGARRVLAARAD